MKYILIFISVFFIANLSQAQFTGTDSLRNYNNKYITTNPATAFTNNRLNTLIRGIIDWVDTARVGTGGGGSIGVDTLWALNDSTIRYRKNGVFRNFILRGVYDTRRKVDTIYKVNDTTIAFKINGTERSIIIPGRYYIDSIYRKNGQDSIYYRKAGIEYAIKDSSGAPTTASNGLTKTGNDIQLGGTLTQNTTISGGPDAHAFGIDSSSSISLLSGLEYISSGIGSFVQMSDSVMNIGSSSAIDFSSIIFSPTRIKFLPADGAGNTGDIWTNTGSGYGHWAAYDTSILATPYDLGYYAPLTSVDTTRKYVPVAIIAGESNGSGANAISLLTTSDSIPFPRVQILNNYTLQFDALRMGVNSYMLLGSGNYFGMELQLKKSMQAGQVFRSDTVYLVKIAYNGATIATLISKLDTTYKRLDTAVAQIRAKGYYPQFFLWYPQGINDYLTDSATWLKATESYLTNIRNRYGYMPVFIPKIMSTSIGVTRNPTIEQLNYWDGFTYVVNTDGFTTQNINHWDSAGAAQLAKKMISLSVDTVEERDKYVQTQANHIKKGYGQFTLLNADSDGYIGGKLGIGITPTVKLHVKSIGSSLLTYNTKLLNSVDSAIFSVRDDGQLSVRGPGGATNPALLVWSPGSTRIRIDGATNTGVNIHNNGVLSFGVNCYQQNAGNFDFSVFNGQTGSSSLNVDGNTNNVGINTLNPIYGLFVERSVGMHKDSSTLISSITSESIQIIDTLTGKFKRIYAANLPVNGVSSLNSASGAVSIVAGTGITISTVSGTITPSVDLTNSVLPHTVQSFLIDANNTSTTETDLYSSTIAANKLGSNGGTLRFDFGGQLSDATATVDLQMYFAGTSFGNTGALALTSTGAFRVTGHVIRTTSTTARAVVTFTQKIGTTDQSYTFQQNLTGLDFTTTNVLKLTGQAGGAGGGSNDITATEGKIFYEP